VKNDRIAALLNCTPIEYTTLEVDLTLHYKHTIERVSKKIHQAQ
jgi:hypothetical protein